ncbi:MAG: ABC transporter permease, partial [Tannerella sp.]|nr:ABC transporter permease [Tannerella sp.]
MILHYLTVAFRNLRKYKSQTLISVIGLAVGFTCFAMAVLWIRYDMSYDSFHKNADRIYCVIQSNALSPSGTSRETPYPLAAYLKETFPEVNHATTIRPGRMSGKISIEGIESPAIFAWVDSSLFGMFDVKIIEGSRDFLIPQSNKAAITQEKARALFGNESPIGKMFDNTRFSICAVVTGYPKRSNYPFDYLLPLERRTQLTVIYGEHTLIELAPGIDVEAFKQKLFEHKIEKEGAIIQKLTLMPLTSVRYEDPSLEREVKFEHIKLFALAGLLVILCSLFNYLTLFVSRFRIRQKELALRRVCGASGRSLFVLLSVEFVLSLLLSLFLGLIFIQLVYEPFQTLTDIRMELPAIYVETLGYIGTVIVFSLLVFWLVLAVFSRRTLNSFIRKSNKNGFRKASIIVQLIISIGFAFCTTVILQQMYFLHNTDLGFAFKNRASFLFRQEGLASRILEVQFKELPEIIETVASMDPLLPLWGRTSTTVSNWEGQPEGAPIINMESMSITEQYEAYYEFRLVEGELLNDRDTENDVLINESAAKVFGWNKSVGKLFNGYTVKGVIKNIYNSAPTLPAKPFFYRLVKEPDYRNSSILFRYEEGTWKACKDKIDKLMKAGHPQASYVLDKTEDAYDNFLKSENALLKLLSFVSLVCVIICISGFVSLVALTCEERRKEIAIRKINGATMRDILSIFFKEYFGLLLVGGMIAFPAGRYIMKLWLEQYVVQTAVPAWIYLSILLTLALVIVLCVGWR